MTTKRQKIAEPYEGSYTPLPHAVLDSRAFLGASDRAKALLIELMRQHNTRNNGHLHLAIGWLKGRGWTSNDQIQKGKTELIQRGLIIKTRCGGLGIGPDRYALTWLAISNFVGLDLTARQYHRGAWRLMDKAPVVKPGRIAPRDCQPASRDNAVPADGVALAVAGPRCGTKTGSDAAPAAPSRGNDVCYQLPAARRRRLVGRAGRSGTWPRPASMAAADAATEVEDSAAPVDKSDERNQR